VYIIKWGKKGKKMRSARSHAEKEKDSMALAHSRVLGAMKSDQHRA
jgi:hypothetical protein